MIQDIKILTTKAEAGDAESQFQLATYYRSKSDLQASVHWLKAACKQTHVFAMTNLAICYYFGDAVEQSFDKAFQLFEEASELGDINASYYLGMSYLNGNGVKKDIVKGFLTLLRCARDGMPWAQLSVADCYKDGIGTPIDLFEAVGWYAHAAQQGIEKAQRKFQAIYYSTHFFDDDGRQRLFWFEIEHLKNKRTS